MVTTLALVYCTFLYVPLALTEGELLLRVQDASFGVGNCQELGCPLLHPQYSIVPVIRTPKPGFYQKNKFRVAL